ncbi:hypothetical protein [Nocardia sp. NPDC060249]|uniref:hypothetical protein n=1 Tax=Nocardia sp. NPDC060249 TaxID=3347082 RepID=UPI003652644C
MTTKKVDPTSSYSGYSSKLYRRVEDLAEIADYTPRGPRHDAAVDDYVRALHSICAQRTLEDWRPEAVDDATDEADGVEEEPDRMDQAA